MKKNKHIFNEKKWRSEFKEFQNAEHSLQPKPEISLEICDRVKRELSPSFSNIILNLILIQLVAGGLTLGICPQFGIGPIGGGHGIVSYVEHLGPMVCGAFCGAFFLFFSAIAAGLFLTRPERKKISQNPILAYSAVSMVSFVFLSFFALMTQAAHHHSFELSFISMWFIAGVLVASLAFTITSNIKNAYSK